MHCLRGCAALPGGATGLAPALLRVGGMHGPWRSVVGPNLLGISSARAACSSSARSVRSFATSVGIVLAWESPRALWRLGCACCATCRSAQGSIPLEDAGFSPSSEWGSRAAGERSQAPRREQARAAGFSQALGPPAALPCLRLGRLSRSPASGSFVRGSLVGRARGPVAELAAKFP